MWFIYASENLKSHLYSNKGHCYGGGWESTAESISNLTARYPVLSAYRIPSPSWREVQDLKELHQVNPSQSRRCCYQVCQFQDNSGAAAANDSLAHRRVKIILAAAPALLFHPLLLLQLLLLNLPLSLDRSWMVHNHPAAAAEQQAA